MKKLILSVVIVLTTIITLAGCKKKEQPTTPAPPAEPNAAAVLTQIEQKMCPIMPEMKINKDVMAEYEGKKVYFCCDACITKFAEEPEKYAADLPQFQKSQTQHHH